MQKLSSKGSPRFGEAGGPATGWKTKLSRGSMLAVSLIILGIMLVSTLSIALVAVQERKASMGENTSNQAYNKAEDGVEKVMQLMKNNAGGTLSSIGCIGGAITSTEGYTVKFKDAADNFIDCAADIASVKAVKSIGTVGQNQRAVEVAVAAPGEPVGTCFDKDQQLYIKVSQRSSNCGTWHRCTKSELETAGDIGCLPIPSQYLSGGAGLDDAESICLTTNNGDFGMGWSYRLKSVCEITIWSNPTYKLYACCIKGSEF